MNTTTNQTSSTTRNWATPGETAAPAAAAASDSLANKEVFLQLLVSQIKNQNPLNPMDGVEFLGQLSQFTQVEQTLGMRQDLAKILKAIETPQTAATGTAATGTAGAGTAGAGTAATGTAGAGTAGAGATSAAGGGSR